MLMRRCSDCNCSTHMLYSVGLYAFLKITIAYRASLAHASTAREWLRTTEGSDYSTYNQL